MWTHIHKKNEDAVLSTAGDRVASELGLNSPIMKIAVRSKRFGDGIPA
jgi:hypothetical protein